MQTTLRVLLLLAAVGLSACGENGPEAPSAPTEPTPTPTPVATQKVTRLALTARQDGRIDETFRRDTTFTAEAAAVCLFTDQACPRPVTLTWGISGAFCELLGDVRSVQPTFVCSGLGVARITACDTALDACGEAQVRIVVP